MCFSAEASFAAAAVLGATGLVSITRKKPDTHRLLAAVPLLFAAQQAAEGLVWRTIHDQAPLVARMAITGFLAFAVVVWPTWMPVALRSAELHPDRRRVLTALAALGVCVSTYAGVVLFQAHPVARIDGHSLAYAYAETRIALLLALYLPFYALATVGPFFVSSLRRAKLMGGLLSTGLVTTFIMKHDALVSTWCFFAALLSAVIVMSIAAEQRLAPARG